MRRVGLAIAARCASVLAMLLTASCSSLTPDTAAAADSAIGFHRAIQDADGVAACGYLAPDTLAQIERSTKGPCSTAVVQQQVPPADQLEDVQAFGRAARVILNGDVVFMTIADGQWKVTAAGCTPRPDRPYVCTIKGG